MKLDQFTHAYLVVALWSSTDDGGYALDESYDMDDIAPETLAQAIEDCADFQTANSDALTEAYNSPLYGNAESAGHDFWLTRNYHGAGFWDRGLGIIGNTLTANAHAYGSIDLYVGDDGLVYA